LGPPRLSPLAGRRPKPTAVHKIEGTLRSRHSRARTSEPQRRGDLHETPDWLTDSQREGWDYAIKHAPKGLLKRIDRGMLVL
jgi:hypothetical protein